MRGPEAQHGAAAERAARFADLLSPDDILTGDRVRARHPGYCARSLDAGVLLRPGSTAELSAICRRAHAAGIAIVPHGGLTGLVDGTASCPGDLIVSFEKMNRVLEIDARQGLAVVEPGVTLQALDEALAPFGMMLGVDIPSRGSCTIGGMIATNAGGTRVLRYGMMRHGVLGLEVVLADGEVLDLLGPLLKNNAGYDLKQVFVGSEGTLGLVSRAALRLWPRPAGVCTALLAFASEAHLLRLFAAAQAGLGPALHAFEAMWPRYYALTTSRPGFGPRPLPPDAAVYAVVETAAASEADAREPLLRVLEAALASGTIADAAVARSDAERATLWRAREDSDAVEAAFDAALTYDIGLRQVDLKPFIDAVEAALRDRFPEATPFFFGHVGDGNLHVMVGLPASTLLQRDAVDALVYAVLARFDGSTLSAEHGIGLEKRPYLQGSVTGGALQWMRTLKRTLDPKNILNPGKVVGIG